MATACSGLWLLGADAHCGVRDLCTSTATQTIVLPSHIMQAAAQGLSTSAVGAQRGIKQSTNEVRGACCWMPRLLCLAVQRVALAVLAGALQMRCKMCCKMHCNMCWFARHITVSNLVSVTCHQVLMVAPTAFVFNDQAAQVGGGSRLPATLLICSCTRHPTSFPRHPTDQSLSRTTPS